MKPAELLSLRLWGQHLVSSRCRAPGEVVSSLVAMQAQEFAMARWAIALRMKGSPADADVEAAFNAGEILRTHVLRPTWHFVAPADIRWLLELTGPRVHTANGFTYRQQKLDAAIFKRSDAVIVRALRGRFLTRTALQKILAKSGIEAEGTRLAALVMHAELEGLICSGPREGRQFTYALLEERAPGAKSLSAAAALAELSRRYFATRGPATAQDFATWSGLTLTQARKGMESLGKEFREEVIDGRPHALLAKRPNKPIPGGFAFLMPDYDEYGMSYKDRRALFATSGKLAWNRMIIVDGQIVGTWRRSDERAGEIDTQYPEPLDRGQLLAVDAAIQRFRRFTDTDFSG